MVILPQTSVHLSTSHLHWRYVEIMIIIIGFYIAHFPLDQSPAYYYYYPVRKSPQSFGFTPAKCTNHQHLIVTYPTTDRFQIRSGRRSKFRLSFLPRDTNTLALVGLELTTLMV